MYSVFVHVDLRSLKVSSKYLEQFWSNKAYTKICEKKQREISRKVSKLELCHLCAACLIIWIYIPIKDLPNTSNSFGVMEYNQKCKKKSIKNTFSQKLHFSPKNGNQLTHASRDPEEIMCEFLRTQVEYFARKSSLPKG